MLWQHALLFLAGLEAAAAMKPAEAQSLMQVGYSSPTISQLEVAEAAGTDVTPMQSLLHDTKVHNINFNSQLNETSKVAPHPFWVFDSDLLFTSKALTCALVMVAAGILCSAGGIGGGGIYVTVLMVAGGLSVHDAVPLSKSVVFFGSISSLVLNLRKSGPQNSETLIDYNVCRLVVPAALVGTYLGVLLNSILPNWVVLFALVSILVSISIMVLQTTYQQYAEEQLLALAAEETDSEKAQELALRKAVTPKSPTELPELRRAGEGSMQSQLSRADVGLAIAMLLMVILTSAFRHHAINCQEFGGQACHHPTLLWLGDDTLNSWMQTPYIASTIKVAFFLVPMLFCLGVLALAGGTLVSKENWSQSLAVKFSIMAVATGCLAGFVGIGGGLIFSPYFLLMGMEPSVAVATSSTCVIFTSSSTTFQYLLTDRIIMSLTVLYGAVNLVASYAGTSLVHHIQDQLAGRRSYISGIVAAGVVISTLLALRELLAVATTAQVSVLQVAVF
eukprot:gb/GFBE01056354.1/.p1 GENE.gb/GFBE01056354.1/~~gb/GFBE01056354.1/.p1  ORF type:complete len:505 (+),score=105.72 gb/GFBE01056354.1/:1-1515(+)